MPDSREVSAAHQESRVLSGDGRACKHGREPNGGNGAASNGRVDRENRWALGFSVHAPAWTILRALVFPSRPAC
jgi:hypothetical protein